jgi:hypothetical protein
VAWYRHSVAVRAFELATVGRVQLQLVCVFVSDDAFRAFRPSSGQLWLVHVLMFGLMGQCVCFVSSSSWSAVAVGLQWQYPGS